MLNLQLEAFADAAGAILAQQRREWSLEHAAFVAEHKAALAELRRENAELLAALKAAADEQRVRVDAALANVKDGEPGPPGPIGPPGESIVGPQGDKGDPGESIEGPPGPQGDKGDPGESIPGPQGERGVGVAAIVREGGRLSLELDDERVFDLGDISGDRGEKGDVGPEGPAGRDGRDGLPGVPGANGDRGLDGKDGHDGIDGKDGLGFDDMTVEYDGERRFTFRLARGDTVKEWTYAVPVQIYRGIYKQGESYEIGDTVTWDGTVWHCNEPTNEPPRESKGTAWTLAVKQGRKGASAYNVACGAGFTGTEKEWLRSLRGPPGPEGKAGRDLTQMDHAGRKW